MPRVNGYHYHSKKDIWFKQHPDKTATVCGFDEVERGYKPVVVRVRTDGWNLAKGLIPLASMTVVDQKGFETQTSKKDTREVLREWMDKNDEL